MGKQWKQWLILFSGGSKITADGDCSHEIKRGMLLGRKAMTNLDSILKSRDITLPTKFHLVKAMVSPVVKYRCKSWIIKKVECQRINAFELLCWRRLLRVPWTARRSNQSILKEISLNIHWQDWCWSWNSNTLATWRKDSTHWKRPWCWDDRRLQVLTVEDIAVFRHVSGRIKQVLEILKQLFVFIGKFLPGSSQSCHWCQV